MKSLMLKGTAPFLLGDDCSYLGEQPSILSESKTTGLSVPTMQDIVERDSREKTEGAK